jgi:hypothetical protein
LTGHKPFKEFVEVAAVGEAGPADSNVLLEAQIFDLMSDACILPVMRSLRFVRFHAPEQIKFTKNLKYFSIFLKKNVAIGHCSLVVT